MDIINSFFSSDSNISFSLFGSIHIFTILLLIIPVLLIIIFHNKLREWKQKDRLRYWVAILMFTNMTIYYLNISLNPNHIWTELLPLHLCFITGYVFMYILLTNNKNLYRIIYPFTFIGPIPAIIFPNLTQGYDRFIFYQFIISHHLMIIMSIFCFIVLEYRVSKKDIIHSIIVGNVYIILIFFVNLTISTNFIMLIELPPHVLSIFPFLKNIPPIIPLQIAGVLAIFISYFPIIINNKLAINKNQYFKLKS